MKKNLAFITFALACLTAAPLASAATWKFATVQITNQPYTESAAWVKVNEINGYFCRHGVYAGKYSPKDDESACASAPRKVGDNWIVDIWLWVAR